MWLDVDGKDADCNLLWLDVDRKDAYRNLLWFDADRKDADMNLLCDGIWACSYDSSSSQTSFKMPLFFTVTFL